MNNNSGVIDNTVRKRVITLIYVFRNIINSFGLVIGSLALNLIDVILGGIVLSQMFSGVEFVLFNIAFPGEYVGWILSVVFWYTQLLLWDTVFRDGKISKTDIPAIALAVIIALIDTFSDSSSVLISTVDSPLKEFLINQSLFGYPLFDILVDTIFIAVIIVTGGNEFFNKLLTSDADLKLFQVRPRRRQKSTSPSPSSNRVPPFRSP